MADLIRILLVDDHAILRSGLSALLELEPDVEIMDIDMPGMGGLAATRQIQEMGLGTRVLVLTSHAESDYLLPVLEAGGSGYVQKTKADEDLISAIRVVARDEVFLYPSATKLLLKGYRMAEEQGEVNPLEELSEREREVLALTAEGFSSSEVGKKLFLSPKTVDTYRARLMQKLGLSHRSELVRLALKTGVLKAE